MRASDNGRNNIMPDKAGGLAGKLVDKETGRREAEAGDGEALLMDEPDDMDEEGGYIFAIFSAGGVG